MSTTMQTAVAKLIVARGANPGGTFELTGELNGIGQAAENQVVLVDSALGPHHATIARRNDRYALFVPEGRAVMIDGQVAPNEQWVWLPSVTRCERQHPSPVPAGEPVDFAGVLHETNRHSKDATSAT